MRTGAVISLEEYRAALTKTKAGKYRNTPTTRDGWRFDSKWEAAFYDHLKVCRAAGMVSWFICQVPFRLGPGVTYRADFLVVMADGRVRILDPKGKETQMFKVKKKLLESQYPVKIETVKPDRKGNFEW